MDEIIKQKSIQKSRNPLQMICLEITEYFSRHILWESVHHTIIRRQEQTFTGMTMDTDRTDMTQAVLEGVAFAIRDSFEVAKSLGIKM